MCWTTVRAGPWSAFAVMAVLVLAAERATNHSAAARLLGILELQRNQAQRPTGIRPRSQTLHASHSHPSPPALPPMACKIFVPEIDPGWLRHWVPYENHQVGGEASSYYDVSQCRDLHSL